MRTRDLSQLSRVAERGICPRFIQYGGKFLHRGGNIEVLESEWPQQRRVIIEFASMEAAKAWWDSPEYEKPKAMRRANSRGRLLLLDGASG